MDKNLPDNIDELFKDSLQHFRDEPSNDIWQKIDHRLDRGNALVYKSRYRFLVWVSGCLLVLLFSLGILTLVHFKNDQNYHKMESHVKGGEMVGSKEEIKNNSRPQNRIDLLPSSPREKLIGKKNLNMLGLNNINVSLSNPLSNHIKEVEKYKSKGSVRSSIVKKFLDVFIDSIRTGSVQLLSSKTFTLKIDKNKFLTDQINSIKKVTNSQRANRLDRFSFTGYFSPEFTGFKLSDNDADAADGREIKKRERHFFSASGGILINYRLNRRWNIQSGLSYSWSSSIIDPSKSYAVNDNYGNVHYRINTISGYGYLPSSSSVAPNVGDSVLTDKAHSRLHYLTIPMIVSYGFKLHRFTLLAGAGVTFNILARATVESKIHVSSNNQNESIVTLYGLKKINYGILLKTELQYQFDSNWWINLIPSFNNALGPINIHSAFSTYPYNFGIGLGISHRF